MNKYKEKRVSRRYFLPVLITALCVVLTQMTGLAQKNEKPKAKKNWGDKNYNPDVFDLKSPVTHTIEGERGEVNILTPMNGRLAHAFYLYRPDHKLPYDRFGHSAFDSYLALHNLRIEQTLAETLTFPTRVPAIVKGQLPRYARGQIWYPRFSPDGRYLLFKYGSPTDPEGWNIIYILDTQTQKMQQLHNSPPAQLHYEFVSWSPDGNYIACVLGGNRYGEVNVIHGSNIDNIGPLTLYVVEWRTGKWHEVARNNTLRGPFHWADSHKLIYGMMPIAKATIPANVAAQNTEQPRPDLYEYSLETNKSRQVMHDGFLPTPSPSGQLVAFFGAESADAAALSLRQDWPDKPSNVALLVAPLLDLKENISNSSFLSDEPWKAKERIVINSEEKVFPDVYWLPDEKHLITLKQIQWGEINTTTNTFSQINKAEIRLWDLTDALTGKDKPRYKLLATLSAQDFERAQRSPVDSAFRGLHISADGKTFYITTNEFTGIDPLNNILYLNKTTLKGVDIDTGIITNIAQTVGDIGIDWFEDSRSAPIQ